MKVLTLSSVFPNPQQPLLGLFIRERIRHIAGKAEVEILAPVPWSPVDRVARWVKSGYRPATAGAESQNGLRVGHPRFLCFPGLMKGADGFLYYWSLLPVVWRIRKRFPFDLIDAHFAYPDGMAAALIARRLRVPFTVTLRGTEAPYSRSVPRSVQMKWVLSKAARVISVSASLGKVAERLGCPQQKIRVIPNGVDVQRFRPWDKEVCRRRLGFSPNTKVLLSVGALVARKGYHRVIELLPQLQQQFPRVVFVIVGGSSVEGDFSAELRARVAALNLRGLVRFEGAKSPEELPAYYSAADVFVLATSNEGWANVFLESLACGTPVVTTDVGGNREVVASEKLGTVVPFGDENELLRALSHALTHRWNSAELVQHARRHSWARVAERVLQTFAEALPGQ